MKSRFLARVSSIVLSVSDGDDKDDEQLSPLVLVVVVVMIAKMAAKMKAFGRRRR